MKEWRNFFWRNYYKLVTIIYKKIKCRIDAVQTIRRHFTVDNLLLLWKVNFPPEDSTKRRRTLSKDTGFQVNWSELSVPNHNERKRNWVELYEKLRFIQNWLNTYKIRRVSVQNWFNTYKIKRVGGHPLTDRQWQYDKRPHHRHPFL